MFDLYSLEQDNEDVEVTVDEFVTEKDKETAVADAGSDTEVTDVSDLSNDTTAHNEAASAGGVATGSNAEDIAMDPVVATEKYIRRHFGLSREDLEEAVDETIQTADAIPDATVVEEDKDLADTTVPGTTVNITADPDTHIDVNAGAGDVNVETDAETVTEDDSANPDENATVAAVDENPSAADVATLEGLRRLWSMEDDEPDTSMSGNADVEFDVKTPENDVNIELEGKAVTIEPNEDEGATAPAEEPAPATGEEKEPETGAETTEEETTEGGEDGEEPEAGSESWYWL